jgi:hypothetical protein
MDEDDGNEGERLVPRIPPVAIAAKDGYPQEVTSASSLRKPQDDVRLPKQEPPLVESQLYRQD